MPSSREPRTDIAPELSFELTPPTVCATPAAERTGKREISSRVTVPPVEPPSYRLEERGKL